MAAGVRKLSGFGHTPDGQVVERWELDNGLGLRAEVLNVGGIVLRLQTPDRNGESSDVMLSPADIETVFAPGWAYLNTIVGRFAGRIGFAKFTLDGRTYDLAANDPPHSLHGGAVGYDRRVWSITPLATDAGPAIELSLTDPDGTENYPGTVTVKVTYTLTFTGIWRIEYQATTDRATPINLTQHAYFNLKDAGRSSITDHVLQLDCTHYTPGDSTLIPTGKVAPVKNTPFDFSNPQVIGKEIHLLTEGMGGYDDNFCIPDADGTLKRIGEVYEPTSGRVMQVFTTEPGVQFYTGNFLDGSIRSLDGFVFEKRSGFCLETQRFPDAPNQPDFPTAVLRPGETYQQITEYRFSTRDS